MKKICIVFVCLLFSVFHYVQAQVGIGTDSPNPHAVLELTSPGNNKGLILPSLTTAQRTSTTFTSQLNASENGLLVYDKDENKFYFWQNTDWQVMVSGTIGGGPTGPAGGDLTGSYPAPQLAAGVVGSTELANNSVLTTKINDAAVTSIKIADGTISNIDINATAAIADAKLATISTAGKVSGNAITSGTIGGSTAMNTSGNITTTGLVTATNATTGSVIASSNSIAGGYAVSGSTTSTNGGGGIYGAGSGVTVGRTTTYSYGVHGSNSFSGAYGWIGGGEGVYGNNSGGNGVLGEGYYGVRGEGSFIGVLGSAPVAAGNYGVFSSGQAGGTTTWAATSDIRFKKNIRPLSHSLDKVLSLRGVSYDWRADEFPKKNFTTAHDLGVIAQEVLTVVPEAVVVDREGYYSVSYEKMVPLLIEAIKELEQKIAELERQQKEWPNIKARLEVLEKMMSAKVPEPMRSMGK